MFTEMVLEVYVVPVTKGSAPVCCLLDCNWELCQCKYCMMIGDEFNGCM